MLNIAFLDASDWDYDVATPLRRPLGGSQSALCYLATALARHGHRVCVANNVGSPRKIDGVCCWNARHGLPDDFFRQPYDAFVVLNGPADICLKLRPKLPPGTPLFLWTQHDTDQPAIQSLGDADVQGGWSWIACVSDWQRDAVLQRFGLNPDRVIVLRNAVAPCFDNLFVDAAELVRAKAGPATLAYTSTPFRGLEVLLDVFPEARAEFPDARLDVYSSMSVYQIAAADDPYTPLYERCRTIPGVAYPGSMAQPRLAEALRGTAVLAYPNTFAETSCIAVMEALAAGLAVVTSQWGALPETCQGLATLVTPREDIEEFGRAYLAALGDILSRRAADPEGFSASLFDQVRAINEQCTWSARAGEWEDAIQR